MERHFLSFLTVAGVVMAVSVARADDFGNFLEKAAKNALREQLAPQRGQTAQAPDQNVETYAVKTADGWTLVAHRYRPTGQSRPGALPVLLCHGLTYNALFWNLDSSCSFAEYLSGHGYDVWAVSLRGCGLSQKWTWKVERAPDVLLGGAVRRLTRGKIAPTGYATVDPRFANWDLDDHINYDVPALVNLVRRHTGAREITWVGHSMGGIVALCHLARYPNPGIGRLVTVGSQVTMPEGQLAGQFLDEMLKTRERQLTGQLQGKEMMAQTKTSVHNMFFNEGNVSPKVYEALSGWATDVPAVGLLQQYMVLSNKGELLDARKKFSYARNLGNIKVPILIGCGELDRFAPPPVQRYLYEHIGSTEKTLVIFGRSQGFSVNAGHDDALVGLNSRNEVYPVIERWLGGVNP